MILAAWYHTIFAFAFAVLAVLLMIVILLQRGKGVGLAGAFGGTGGTTAFGAKTGDVLTWITIVGAAVLLTYTVALNYLFRTPTAGLAGAPTQTAAPADSAVPTEIPLGPVTPVAPSPVPITPAGTPGARPITPPAATPTPAPAGNTTPAPAGAATPAPTEAPKTEPPAAVPPAEGSGPAGTWHLERTPGGFTDTVFGADCA